jgi:hypothetical protein
MTMWDYCNANYGPEDIPAPETWVECPECRGAGHTVHRITVYEHGCGFPHDDTEERPCERCRGEGGWIDDVEPDGDDYADRAEWKARR